MSKTILMTGGSDGLGLASAKILVDQGHRVFLHGRNPAKTEAAAAEIGAEPVLADLSDMAQVLALAETIKSKTDQLDVLINNAGILKSPQTITPAGIDVRFMVNTLAPFALAQALLPIIPKDGRIVNLSSAAQAPVDLAAMADGRPLEDMAAYAQSKLAITQWTAHWATLMPEGPLVVSVNPGSLLATKMVREGFGMAGNDMSIGTDIITRAALSEEFEGRSGAYFDQDARAFGPPHPDAQDAAKCKATNDAVRNIINGLKMSS